MKKHHRTIGLTPTMNGDPIDDTLALAMHYRRVENYFQLRPLLQRTDRERSEECATKLARQILTGAARYYGDDAHIAAEVLAMFHQRARGISFYVAPNGLRELAADVLHWEAA